ncbi:MAG: hypothetical protein ACLPYB_12490 [Desulfobaccales bacterium]
MSGKYLIQAVAQALAVEEFLVSEKPLEWKGLEEISGAVLVSKDKVFRILKTLATPAAGRVEESDKGWRISPKLVRFALKANEYFYAELGRFGLKERLP